MSEVHSTQDSGRGARPRLIQARIRFVIAAALFHTACDITSKLTLPDVIESSAESR